eukprot:scaffold109610_cov39-Phaeocystis_antarctica.AAC.1
MTATAAATDNPHAPPAPPTRAQHPPRAATPRAQHPHARSAPHGRRRQGVRATVGLGGSRGRAAAAGRTRAAVPRPRWHHTGPGRKRRAGSGAPPQAAPHGTGMKETRAVVLCPRRHQKRWCSAPGGATAVTAPGGGTREDMLTRERRLLVQFRCVDS